MAKYLWWRGSSGWTFQIGIPKVFVNRYGATPFRVALGSLSTTEARRRSRILAGYVTATFGETMSREAVVRGLTEVATQLDKLSKQETSVKFAILRSTGALYEMEEGSFGHLAEPSPAHHEQALAVARAERALLRNMREGLDQIGREIVRDGEKWTVERDTYTNLVGRLAQQKPVKDLPTLTVAAEAVIEAKSKALTAKSAGYIARLRRAVRAFASIIGDKPISEYFPLDVQTYATTLGMLPSTWASDSRLRDLSPHEIIKRAENIKGLKPISKTTVAEYLSEFRAVWKVIRATYPHDVLSLAHNDLYVTLPRTASRPVDREGLSVENLNRFLAEAARRRRPDDRFLPLLATLTGARLGELVYLQVEDVMVYGDHYILSLLDDIENEDGGIDERKLKTDTSRRMIALPDAIKETGFVDWVRSLRGGTLWPHLLKTARPHATASKHMIRLMKAAGVHSRLKQTFHSLRHGYKDHLRNMKVDRRTMNRQVGHASETVEEDYGSKVLRPDEVETLATLPLPHGLDLTPYRKRDRS